MELILILLVSTLMGAFFVGFFLLGVYVGRKQGKDKLPELTEQNKEYVKGIATFFDYRGE